MFVAEELRSQTGRVPSYYGTEEGDGRGNEKENRTEKLRRWVRIRSTPDSAQTTSRIQSCNTASPQACLLSRGIHRQSFPYNFAFTPWHFISSNKHGVVKQTSFHRHSKKKHMQIYTSGKLVTSEVPINHQKKKNLQGQESYFRINTIHPLKFNIMMQEFRSYSQWGKTLLVRQFLF